MLVLLEAGACADGPGSLPDTPLMAAATAGHVEIIKTLLQYNAEIDLDRGHGTALIAACRWGKLAAAKFLAEAGADTNKVCVSPLGVIRSPMLSAAHTGRLAVMKWLKAQGAPFEFQAEGTWATALHAAVVNKCAAAAECIRWLINNSNNPNKTDSHARTPLHGAARFQNDAAVSLLIAAGARVNAAAANGTTVLHTAAGFNAASCVTLLLQAGAAVDQRNVSGG